MSESGISLSIKSQEDNISMAVSAGLVVLLDRVLDDSVAGSIEDVRIACVDMMGGLWLLAAVLLACMEIGSMGSGSSSLTTL
jgi:crotonobetainyl-CoA:carnitine CoA-transferase CaiB-like acyl-CoA transferase